MRVIGITGGVGAGKSEVMKLLEQTCRCRTVFCDDVANRLKEPGEACYEEMVQLLGCGILKEDGAIDRGKMAELIFSDPQLLARVNAVIHPAVKAFITNEIEKERQNGFIDYFMIEAALLIEDGYDKICDELWYIHADEAVRRERLLVSRGYSSEKTSGIMKNQKSREEFGKYCTVTIDNSKDMEHTRTQIIRALAESSARE